jgi:hypothetical protein
MKKALAVSLLGLSSLLSQTAHAEDLYNNLNDLNTTNYLGILDYAVLGDSFSTGNSPFYLTQVELALKSFGKNTSGTTTVELFSNQSTTLTQSDISNGYSSDSPLSYLATLGSIANNSITNAQTLYTFAPSSNYLLAANTRYWIEVTSTGHSAFWSYSGNSNPTDESYLYQSQSFTNASGPFIMSVSGSPVSEPAIDSLLVIGLMGLGLARYKAKAA